MPATTCTGSWLLALGSWLLALGSWLLALGSWLLALGSWLLALGCCSIPTCEKTTSQHEAGLLDSYL